MYPAAVVPMRDFPARQRPRELFEQLGPDHVEDYVLVALILRVGTKGMNVVELARRLLDEYGSLTQMAQASADELARVAKGMGKVKAQMLKAALEMGHRMVMEQAPSKAAVRTPQEAADLLRSRARGLEQENFWVLLLDARNNLKRAPVQVSQGLLDASLVHAREVFKEAIRTNSAAVVLVHNHPSGDPGPSAEDLRITRQLIEAGRIIDIRVLDHVILGHGHQENGRDFVSLRESGLVEFPS
jgi:DNA repair protein RadC